MKTGVWRLIVAAAISLSCVFGFAAISSAATQGKPLSLMKYTRHHVPKKTARHHSHHKQTAQTGAQSKDPKSSDNTQASAKPLAPDVANAHAEFNAGVDKSVTAHPTDAIASTESTLTSSDKTAAPDSTNGVPIAASDQFNDIDRAAAEPVPESAKSAATLAQTPSETTAVPSEQLMNATLDYTEQVSTPQSGAWDGASLVGKVFIGIGLVLTLASAARLIVA